ncbi:MAG: hypothetical protein KatS3mg077_2823 [Candidatus Binatia bacterium]|nr:MAG: hypothetical protein KatS3mg077_2823 [Candidatus Binatia bacterium]
MRYSPAVATLAVLLWSGLPGRVLAECEQAQFASTWDVVQNLFVRHGCTNDLCHGAGKAGGLDLRAPEAYANLVERDAQTVPGMKRVLPGLGTRSLLFLNLAAKTLPDQYRAPLRPMPLDPLPALSWREVELVRLWIQQGAPEAGVVPGTTDLVDACLPPPQPVPIRPLQPPEPGKGFQLRMPPWLVPPHSEKEVCFVSYFDVRDRVPVEFRAPGGLMFRFRANEVRQSPVSHHMIANLYVGRTPLTDPIWGEFRCRGGERDGEPCPPTDVTFCGNGLCASEPVEAVGCAGFGPPDLGQGLSLIPFSGSQQVANEMRFPPGVYQQLPMRGVIVWNAHSFNLGDEPAVHEAWLNWEFAPPEEARMAVWPIAGNRDIYKMTPVPPFSTREVCSHYEFPRFARLFQLSGHGHKRMKRWRTFEGKFACQGGPAAGQACSPLGYDFNSPDVCEGFPCQALERERAGDCNEDGVVTIEELVRAVNVALGAASVDQCVDADRSGDDAITIEELVFAVNAALAGVPPARPRDPHESLLYLSTVYSDMLVLNLAPPRRYDAVTPDKRTITYCALYDNGFTDPTAVKRKSTSPLPSSPGVAGGPCEVPTHCTEGRVGAPCSGATQEDRDRSCDSSPGALDGRCDACPLTGGVTTEDEMFVLLGLYYIAPAGAL